LKKMLIAVNDNGFVENIKRRLKQPGEYEIETAATVAEAKEAFGKFQPDIVVINNLDGSGVELGVSIGKLFQTPIINVDTTESRVDLIPFPLIANEGYFDRLVEKIVKHLGM
jgi:DNA-binding response OmpR family regulator